MIPNKFNCGWRFSAIALNSWDVTDTSGFEPVNLPHDAMILEVRDPECKNGVHTGFYPGNTYTYLKTFAVSEDMRNKELFLEFDGIFSNAMVYVNGALAAQRPYGYSQFDLRLNDHLIFGGENEIKVVADTSAEMDSRWYTGGGICRDIKLYVGEPLHVDIHGLRVHTEFVEDGYAVVLVQVDISNAGRCAEMAWACIELKDACGNVLNSEKLRFTAYSHETVNLTARLGMDNPKLWSCETPSLYFCEVRITSDDTEIDRAEARFGIRQLQLDVKHGLRINGIETKLRGTCIHHDNGIIGAVSLFAAERRRIRLLKEAGFNCIRSAHAPASPTLLDVCDELGMLVMDESFDTWTNPKRTHDYANVFLQWWERDIEAMVRKDYNHPCVILYSIGNEIDEAGTAHGAEWNRKIANAVRRLDSTRYITNGVNGMIAVMDKLEELIPDIIRQVNLGSGGSGEEGSNLLNNLVSLAGGETGDALYSHPMVGERTEAIFGGLDVAGMNYMTSRYESDHHAYPNRIILGTETFPADIVRLWDLTQRNAHVIGDMTWVGYDYLGEAGCGVFRYDCRNSNFDVDWPARTAYVCDIDILGKRRPISYLRETVYGLRKEPYISVEKPYVYDKPVTKSPWMLYDDIASWTWPGYEGKPVVVRVFSASEKVELFINGKSLGIKPTGKDAGFTAEFVMEYIPGDLLAVGYTAGRKDGDMRLSTASDRISLSLEPEYTGMVADGESLCYVPIRLRDENGILNAFVEKEVTVKVSGEGTLAGFGSAEPEGTGNYYDHTWPTFEGSVMAVIRSTHRAGTIKLEANAEGLESKEIIINTHSK